jgi:two-component system, cell cycle sensor histidine kinase and response regulator CckA
MKKKILVVDDDRVILKFVTKLLEKEGHDVKAAEDGFAALNLLTAFTPDLMFFDLIMPKIDGDKLIKIVRTMPHLQNCYLVIISAAVAEIDFNFEATGADSYIAKGPFNQMAEHILAVIAASELPRRKGEPKPIRGLDTVFARQLTKELLSRNRHLETILESMAEGIVEVFTGKIVYANSAAIAMVGLPQEKMLAASPRDLFKEDVAKKLETVLKLKTDEPVKIGENVPVELNGKLVTIQTIPVKDDPATIIIMITDVTERKRLEIRLQHVQKMEAIGTIAAGVAHNFRNTLTEVLVNSQLIQTNYKDEAGLHDVAERINTSVKRGSRLVDGLLQFSRKQIKKEFIAVDLSQIIDQIYQLIQKSFDNKIKIHTDLPEPLMIMGDPSSLSQAVMNLCTNARDAMPEGGQLVIKAVKEGYKAVVTVADTGQGMNRETLEKCFDPFFTTKPVGKGTGLGLSTTYGIIKSHEGLIQVESAPDKGTIFTIQFPLTPGKGTTPRKNRPEIIHGQGERVLVVDDESEILRALEGLLLSLGYQPALAGSGKEGLQQYRSIRPDAVLMDINLPEMDGITCISEMLNFDPNARISIISGYEQNAVNGLNNFIKEKIKGYLVKPVDMADLSALLAEMLKR